MTIPAPHQLRVLNEEAELAERLGKLTAFLESDKVETVPRDELLRLLSQVDGMNQYLAVLRLRIANF
jgi:phosphoenolpyruvate carboxylase